MGTKHPPIGIPKKRRLEDTDELARFGKISEVKDFYFSVKTKNHGIFSFWKRYSKIFNEPSKGERVQIYYHGNPRDALAYKVLSEETNSTLYSE